MLYLDFETRSECDLPTHGVYNYARDSTTEVLCLSYAFDDDEVQTWTPDAPFPEAIRSYTGEIRAHNAAFERLIFWYVLHINFKLEQFYCTAAQARANCLPGSLEDVGRALSSKMKKDHRGKQLIRLMCVPPFNESPELMAEMIAYCEQDVRAMRAIAQTMRQLSATELLDYHVNERINDRGVLVDTALCLAAVQYASVETDEIQKLVADITKGEVLSVRSPKMRSWVQARVGEEALKLMYNGERYSIDKTVRANLLTLDADQVPHDVADVIQCADDIWASSVAKFKRLADLADQDDKRVRGAFVFNGGAATGRASSYGAQVHNFTRKCVKDPQATRDAMVRGHSVVPKFGVRVTDVLKGMLRPSLIPAPGNVLIVADWAGIEARCNPWLSGDAEDVLQVFRDGSDIYVREAQGIFRVIQVSPEQRQVGKVAILACGYGGGVGAFAAMSKAYGVSLTESEAKRTVDAWRRANQWAVTYWQQLEIAYMKAMRHKGREFSAGRVTYMFDGIHLWYILPSSRVLCYPFARLEAIPSKQKSYASSLVKGDRSEFDTGVGMMLDAARSGESPYKAYSQKAEFGVTYLKAAWKPTADAKEWPRARLWKGLACENITQAVANDLLRHSLRQIDAVLHIHDEIVVECAEKNADAVAAQLEHIMCTPPAWATGLPLSVEVKIMKRYGK
jgi:DNA polymerase